MSRGETSQGTCGGGVGRTPGGRGGYNARALGRVGYVRERARILSSLCLCVLGASSAPGSGSHRHALVSSCRAALTRQVSYAGCGTAQLFFRPHALPATRSRYVGSSTGAPVSADSRIYWLKAAGPNAPPVCTNQRSPREESSASSQSLLCPQGGRGFANRRTRGCQPPMAGATKRIRPR